MGLLVSIAISFYAVLASEADVVKCNFCIASSLVNNVLHDKQTELNELKRGEP